MKVKLIGMEKKDFKFQDGKEYHGKDLHVMILDKGKPEITGNLTAVYKIKDEEPLSAVPLTVGKEYVVFFNDAKRLDYISESAPGK